MTPLKPSQLEELLSKAIPAKLPVLISGKPGIGKSEIVEAATKAAKAALLILHPVISDPTDYKGLPTVDGTAAKFLPFGDLKAMIDATKPLVVFFDDLGQAPPAVQAALMQLVLARRVNGHAISKHVVFVAATNRRADRAGVQGILEPLKGRFPFCIELGVDAKEWRAWAAQNGIAPEIQAYIAWREHYLSDFRPTNDMTNSASPRTWKFVSDQMALGLPKNILNVTIQGAVGEPIGTEFAAFLRVWQDMVNPDVILINPDTADIPAEPSALAAVTFAVAKKVTKANVGRFFTYMERLMHAGHREFAALGVKLSAEDRKVVNTAEYVKAMSGPLGRLLV